MWDELMFEAHVIFVYINITFFIHRVWVRPILILMTMKYVCRIALMILLFACQVSMKAVVVFDAKTDKVVNNAVTKNGITISGLSGNSDSYIWWNSDISINSDVGNIIMIGICYCSTSEEEGEATNGFHGEFNEGFKAQPYNSTGLNRIVNLNKMDVTEESVENVLFNVDGLLLNSIKIYSVWHGMSNIVTFNDIYNYIGYIYVYLEGDVLPEKKPYALYYHETVETTPPVIKENDELCFFYGYIDFIGDRIGKTYDNADFFDVKKYRVKEDGSIPEYSNLPKMKNVKFDESFSEYQPNNISHWFDGIKCNNSVDFSKLDLSEVNEASNMFNNSNVDVINLRISEGNNLSSMFCGYRSSSLDISSWSFSSKPIVTGMFANTNISNLRVSMNVQGARDDLFEGLGYSKKCNLNGPDELLDSLDEDGSLVFWKGGRFQIKEKEAYVSIEENDFEPEGLQLIFTLRYDRNRYEYSTVSLDEEDQDGIKKWIDRFESYSEEWDYDEDGDKEYKYSNMYVCISPSFADYRPTSTSKWFYCLYAKQDELDGLEYINTSEVTDMSYMFAESGFKNIDVSHFNTSKVTDMSYMFFRCDGLTSLDVSHFDTSKVTDMSMMFYDCLHLKSLNLSNFDTSNVTNMSYMFTMEGEGTQLENLDVSSFNTSKVTDMSFMFADLNNINSLDLSNFDTANVTNMCSMFMYCSNLTSLDVSNFSTSNVTNMYCMFCGCSNLTSLDVRNFDTSNLVEGDYTGSSGMYAYCTSLQDLSISSTMSNIRDNACKSVGTKDNPCTIYAPYGFDFGTDTTQPYFQWKGGYFVKGTVEVPITVGDTITYDGLQYQVTKVDENGNEVTLLKNPDAQGEINIPSIITDESGTIGFYVTAIEDYAFYNCANITKLTIPASVQSIGKAVTSCCTILNEITVAENNPYYDSRDNCNAVINSATGELIAGCNKTTIPEGVTAIGVEAMRGMFDLEGIVLPKTLTRIGNRAFYYCKKLTGHLVIPEGVTEIETYAFYKCTGLTAISLPSTITTMGSCAFRECTNVTWVSCYAVTPPSIDSRMFGKFDGCTLMVPIASVDSYKAAANWKKFNPIIRESVVSVEDVTILTGNKGTARISLDNGTNVYTGCQFNITLPEGTDLVKQTHGGYEYTISNRFSGTPSIQITPQDDGSYMVLIYSMNSSAINGSDGVLITLPIKADANLPIGDYTGTITKIAFNNPDNTSAYLQDVTFNISVPAFTLGDVNHDRTVNITDVMMTVNHVVGQTPAGFHVEDADVNGDHVINISDIMAIVNLVVNATSSNAPAHAREAMTDAISLMPTTSGYAISLKNTEPYTALQMDIQLPNDAPLNAHLTDSRSDGHSIICLDLGNGHHRIAVYSLNGHAIMGNDGILLQLETYGKHETLPEVYNVQLTNNIFENVTLSDISFPTDITNVNMDNNTDVPAYNVQGIRAPKHHRGILIQNGRKRVEKR